MTIQEILRVRLKQSELSDDVILDIARVEQKIKNFCDIDEIPEALHFVAADMVIALQKKEAGDDVSVASVKMGDTSYSFGCDRAIDKVMGDYASDLIDYSRLRW